MSNTWNQVLHGRNGTKRWDFLNPDPSAVDWPTIALVLARIPRFNGHTTQGPYSVAQHLVEGARAILRETARKDWAGAYLLHDAHEFVIGDDVRPKVEALAILASFAAAEESDHTHVRNSAYRWLKAAFRELKTRADAVIYPAAGLPWPLSPEAEAVVRLFDNRMLRTEADARTGPRVAPWGAVVEDACPVEGADCSPWPAELAASLWLSMAHELLPALQPAEPVLSGGDCECCDDNIDALYWREAEMDTPLVPNSAEAWQLRSESGSDIDWQGFLDSPASAPLDVVSYGAIASDTLRYSRPTPLSPPCDGMTGSEWNQQPDDREMDRTERLEFGRSRIGNHPLDDFAPGAIAPDTLRYGNKRSKHAQPALDVGHGPNATFPRLESAGLRGAKIVGREQVEQKSRITPEMVRAAIGSTMVEVKDWCDWADGSSRTLGTCTACGGVFGMFARPSVCLRSKG